MGKCIKCGSENVMTAKLSGFTTVKVENKNCKWYQLSDVLFNPVPLVCLDCRHIELTISENDLKSVQNKLAKKSPK
ncbi:MAG: hypothetical protein PHW04_15560 [Candidatus Wallbacteria bacterium]|nr:hypothetical protein [Candidatus Wallbacteria bacterium]